MASRALGSRHSATGSLFQLAGPVIALHDRRNAACLV